MDIYLTNLSTGERLRFPLLPDRLSVSTGASVLSFNIIGTGEHRFPRGVTCTGYSWNAVFPGEAMSGMRFVHDWQKPTSIIHLLKNWESKGETLRLMVTDLSINEDVFIQTFNYDHYGVDDVSYAINLAVKRQLIISTTPPPPKQEVDDENDDEGNQTNPGDSNNNDSTGDGYKPNGTKPPTGGGTSSGGSYTVRSGDTLMSIAKKQLGDATRFAEIYSLNKNAIDAANAGKTTSKYTIYPGMKLRLPSKSNSKPPASSTVAAAAAAAAAAGAVAAGLANAVKSAVSSFQSVVTKIPSAKVVKVTVNAPKKVKNPAAAAASKFFMKAMDR